MDRILEHDRRLTSYALRCLEEVPGLSIQGPANTVDRGGVVSFDIPGIDAHDVAKVLDPARRGGAGGPPLRPAADAPAWD